MHIKSAAPNPALLLPWNKTPSDKKTIGVVKPCYGSSRVIFGLPNIKYSHVTLPVLPLSKLDRKSTFFEFTPIVIDQKIPLLHTWNAIPLNRNFIMSFELEIPRYLGKSNDKLIKFGLDRLSSNRCRKLLALSEFARRHAIRVFEEYGYQHLSNKLAVFRGGVWDPFASSPLLDSNLDINKPLTAIVIGTQLFRKGGMYSIEAFEILRNKGFDVRLTLVGDFESSSYAFKQEVPEREVWINKARSHKWITMIPPVPFAEVYKLILSHDICLYPSLDESLGWLPIEAAMAGKPVVGARVAAFPEFVHHMKTGYLIDLPVGFQERWEGLFKTGKEHRQSLVLAHELMVNGIVDALEMVYTNRELLEEWGAAGRVLIKDLYDIEKAGKNLELIYDEFI